MRIGSARTRALVGFAALGLYWGAWGAALPAVQRETGSSDAELGLALVVLGAGALVSMRATGILLDRFGPRLTPLTVAALGLTGLLTGLAGSPLELVAALFLVGAASGAMDVAINADAVREEDASGRPLMNLAHAAFSGAVVVASLGTGALRWADAPPSVIFALAALLVLAAALAMRTAETWIPPAAEERPRLLQRIPAFALILGGLGALAYWVENAWQSWGAVHLERTLGAEPGPSALAPALFAGSMAVGRLLVHRLASPGSERRVLVGGALVAAVGSAVGAFAGSTGLALLGIAVAGAGCAVCAPTVLSLAGGAARPAERATVVGSVTTIMYFGFLVGPAAVGGLAEATSLRTSLGAVAATALVLAGLSAVARFPPRSSG